MDVFFSLIHEHEYEYEPWVAQQPYFRNRCGSGKYYPPPPVWAMGTTDGALPMRPTQIDAGAFGKSIHGE
jgi:hypothetical protein